MYWSPRFCASLSVTFRSLPRSFESCTSPPRAFDGRDPAELLEQARAQEVHVDAGAVEQRARAAALLVEEREHQVRGLDELLVAADGERLRVRERELEFGRQSIRSHARHPHVDCPGSWGRPAADSTRGTVNLSAFLRGFAGE